MQTIPAFIRSSEDTGMLELALVENLHRADLNAIELAFSYQRLMEDCKLTQDQLAERISKKRETISNYVRLLKLPEEIQSEIYRQVNKQNLSVRATEALVKSATGNPSPAKPTSKSYAQPLGAWAGKAKAQVTLSPKGNGSLNIRFSTEQELKDLLDRIS
jgi:ParB family chromosome partitioning protein